MSDKMGAGGLHREMTLAEISEGTTGGAENVPVVLHVYAGRQLNQLSGRRLCRWYEIWARWERV